MKMKHTPSPDMLDGYTTIEKICRGVETMKVTPEFALRMIREIAIIKIKKATDLLIEEVLSDEKL